MNKLVLRELSSLSGPRGLPVLGSLLALEAERLHLVLEDWAREHGEYFVFRIINKPVLAVANADAILKLLRERPNGFRRSTNVREYIEELGAKGVFSAEGERWTRQRKLVMAAFNATHVRSFHDTVARITDRLLRHWRAAAKRGEPLDAVAELMRYTVDVTTSVAFGQDMNTIEQGEGELQQRLALYFGTLNRRLRMPFPYWRYVKLPSDRAMERARAEIEKVVFGIIREARATLEREPARAESPRNLLEAMLVAHDADDPRARLTDQEIYGNVLTLLLAGEDTTALTMAWMLYFLATHPEVARKLREEVDAQLGDAELPRSAEDVHALEYASAVVKETLRLKGAAPLMFYEPLADTVIGDIAVPAGTLIVTLTRAAANTEEHFSNPQAFVPERWLDGQAGRPAQHDARAAMPFGSGPRICPGRALALLECSMVAAMVVRHFDVQWVDTGTPVGERFDFTMRPDHLRIRLVPRSRD